MAYTRAEGAPSFMLTALETRAAVEYATFPLARPLLTRLRQGDGHSVLVLPGFTAGDNSTRPLRQLLRDLGYRSYGWHLGANIGPTRKIIDGMLERFDHVVEQEQGPISIVGWSLGGIYARALARRNPDAVRQVITLGSPIRMMDGDGSAVSGMWEALAPLHDREAMERLRPPDRPPLAVPATSIYTRTDGIVPWRTCLETRGPIAENIEVYGSHSGLGFNPAAVLAVANRLAQRPGNWRRFRPPVWAWGAYPRAANWRPPKLADI